MAPRYSGCIPRGLRDAYEKAASDESLLCLRDDFALLEARQVSLLNALESSPPPPWAEVLQAADSGDMEAVKELARNGVVSQIVQDALWRELREIVQEKTQVSTAESRRLVALSLMMTKEQALRLVAALIEAVTKHVEDQDTLRNIKRSIGAITVAG